MTYRALIGFSGKMASGKTTTSRAVMNNIFKDNDFKVISFADALRSEVDEIITGIQSTKSKSSTLDLEIFELVPEYKRNYVIDVLWETASNDKELTAAKKTAEIRHILQYWGTSVRRKENNNYWVGKLNDKVSELHYSGFHVCVDDVRFINEASSLILNDGVLVRLNIDEELQRQRLIARDGVDKSEEAKNHLSETALDEFPWFNLEHQAKETENLVDTAKNIAEDLALLIAQQKSTYELQTSPH